MGTDLFIMKNILIFTCLLLLTACPINWKNRPNGAVSTSSKHSQQTPKGVFTQSPNKLSSEQLQAIDDGLTRLFNDVPDTYTTGKEFNGYMVIVPKDPCILSPVQKVPSWEMRADDYDGTEFDHYNPEGEGKHDGVGVIYAAEMVTDLERGVMIACSEQNFVNGEAVRNGAEHIIAYRNDKDYFNYTWWHGNGIYHPIYPKLNQKLVGFVGLAPYGDRILVPTK